MVLTWSSFHFTAYSILNQLTRYLLVPVATLAIFPSLLLPQIRSNRLNYKEGDFEKLKGLSLGLLLLSLLGNALQFPALLSGAPLLVILSAAAGFFIPWIVLNQLHLYGVLEYKKHSSTLNNIK